MSKGTSDSTGGDLEDFRPCIAVPVFNHRDAVEETLRELLAFGLRCIAVNDGSSDGSAEVLDALGKNYPLLQVFHRPQNGGKGAAVLDALRLAEEQGATHVLFVDADRQHDSRDIPKFLEAARANPRALILGVPQFEADAPPARVYGREISNVLACIQTLSLVKYDVLCGFRVYPLGRAYSVLASSVRSRRMEFDIEAVVRLRWSGISVVTIATAVRYPAGGLSHFRYARDNLMIASTHIRLLLGMLVRLPRLVGRAAW